ncbi:hypothetical protein PHYC_02972 [Phycisphaerales bacterium]|nr:hypothetical protein PHYC_02972 [Phycisphaerales bacterium]
MQRRHHYEQALESYLRARRIPYVAVDEARKALLPEGDLGALTDGHAALKSFDLVIYGEGSNLLLEVKGRRVISRSGTADTAPKAGRLESWVTLDDVESLGRWESLFGSGFEAAFVFVYWCDQLPPDALFEEIFEHAGRWYAIKCVRLRDYREAMKVRSPRWRTVDLAPRVFADLAAPLAPGQTPEVAFRGGLWQTAPPAPLLDRLSR